MKCHLCDNEFENDLYGLPFYEGKVVWNSDYCAPVCKSCHDVEYAKIQVGKFWKTALGDGAQEMRVVSPFVRFKKKAEWDWQFACWIYLVQLNSFRILITTGVARSKIEETRRACAYRRGKLLDPINVVMEIRMRPYGKYGATTIKAIRIEESALPIPDPDGSILIKRLTDGQQAVEIDDLKPKEREHVTVKISSFRRVAPVNIYEDVADHHFWYMGANR